MKTLKESILSSTRTGAAGEAIRVKEWFKKTNFYNVVVCISRKLEVDVTCTPAPHGSWRIDLQDDIKGLQQKANEYCAYFGVDDTVNGFLPYRIYGVFFEGNPMNIRYQGIKFKSSDDIVQACGDYLTFDGCDIGVLDRLPNGCENLLFESSSGPNKISAIKNIVLKGFHIADSKKGSLPLSVLDIKNIAVYGVMEISSYMLGADTVKSLVDKGRFKEEPSKLLDEFFKNNHINAPCKLIESGVTLNMFKIRKHGEHWILGR